MKPIFSNAVVVKFGALPNEYGTEKCPRGASGFTMRAHAICEIRRNPRRWLLGYESPESKSKEYGDVLDCLTLTPKQWPQRYAITPQTYTNKKGELSKWRNDLRIAEIAEWHKDHEGLTIVDADTNASVHAAIKRLREDSKIAEFIDSGRNQCWVSANYEDRATGLVIPVKCLIDIVPHPEHPIFGRCLGDLKSTRNAEPRRFARDAFQFGYHVAAAWYMDLFCAATGEDRTDFVHVVQESFPPYEPRMPIMSAQFVNLGRLVYQDTLALYCRCLANNYWPSYDPKEGWPMTEPEPWMLDQGAIYTEPEEEPEEAPEETAEITP